MTRRRRLLIRLAWLAAFVGALAWVVGRPGWRRTWELAAAADPWWLALSLVPLAGRFLLWALKWWGMLRAGPEVPYAFALRSVLAGAFVNLTTPTAKLAGGVLRAALLHRRTRCGVARAYGWALADQLTNLLGNLALIAVVATATGLAAPGGGGPFLGPGLFAAALVVAVLALRGPVGRGLARPRVATWLARLAPRRIRAPETDPGDGGWIGRVLEPFARSRATAGATLIDLALGAAGFAALCLAGAMALRALGVEAPLAAVATCVALGTIAGTLTGTMGGIGATELALIELFAAIGVPRETATAAALLHRAGFYLVTLLWGGPSLWRLARSGGLPGKHGNRGQFF